MIAKDIAQILNATLVQQVSNVEITNLLLDSRKIFKPSCSLFFAIHGNQHNGHDFIEYLIEQGVTQFVIEQRANVNTKLSANFIIVEDSLKALQKLTQYHREQFDLPIIGITGSNGKTIVKEWVSQLLFPHFSIVKSPKSYNSQIGVPLSIWELNHQHSLGIFEAGISEMEEMQNLEKIIQPSIGILTNLGTAHAKGFTSKKEKLSEKLKLFQNAQVLIHSLNDEWLVEQLKDYSLPTFTWGSSPQADVCIQSIKVEKTETIISYSSQEKTTSISIPFTDTASIENVLHCITTLLYLKVDILEQDLSNLSQVSMRLEVKEGILGSQLIDDSYNNDFLGLKIGLEFLGQQAGKQQKIVVLSDVIDSFTEEKEVYTNIAQLLEEKKIDLLITVGQQLKSYSSFFKVPIIDFETTDDLLKQLDVSLLRDKTVLIKGARNFSFEKIVQEYEYKKHQTIFEINLTALGNNLTYLRSKIPPHTKTMAMVKAFAYGSGSAELIFALQFHKVDYLAVAYIDEGIALREQGVNMPIMVMNPEEHAFEKMISYQLEPEIYSLNHLKTFLPYVKEKTKIHIKLDTGMRRLGFEENDLEELCFILEKNPLIHVESVFSHLAGVDEEVHDVFTNQQVAKFEKYTHYLQKNLSIPFWRHILNSAGIQRFPHAAYDCVRLGIALYGIGVNETEQENLQPIGTLKTHISQIKHISAGESIGYSRKCIAQSRMKIATIAIGYADGFDRRFSNGVGKVEISGKLCEIVGNVCMDMCMIDISHLLNVKEGDEVIIFGGNLPIYNQSNAIQTIPYELLTKVSNRVKRIFYSE